MGWIGRSLKALALTLFAVAAGIGCLAFFSARSMDPLLYPPQPGEPTIAIALADHGVHTGIVLRLADIDRVAIAGADPVLMAVAARFGAYPYVEIGWGDEQFYRFAPSLSDVTVTMAARALLGMNADSVLHIVGLRQDAMATFIHSDVQTISLSQPGFERLLHRLSATFATDGHSQPVELGEGLYGPSLFYRAKGHYSLLNTCNRWIADLLYDAGLAASPVPAVLSSGLLAEVRLRNPL